LEPTGTLQARNGVHIVEDFWRQINSLVPVAVLDCVLTGDVRQNEINKKNFGINCEVLKFLSFNTYFV